MNGRDIISMARAVSMESEDLSRYERMIDGVVD